MEGQEAIGLKRVMLATRVKRGQGGMDIFRARKFARIAVPLKTFFPHETHGGHSQKAIKESRPGSETGASRKPPWAVPSPLLVGIWHSKVAARQIHNAAASELIRGDSPGAVRTGVNESQFL